MACSRVTDGKSLRKSSSGFRLRDSRRGSYRHSRATKRGCPHDFRVAMNDAALLGHEYSFAFFRV